MLLKNLDYYLRDFMLKRTDEIGRHILMKNSEYQELSETLRVKLNEILTLFPDQHQDLIMEYEEKEHAQSALAVELMYKQGLLDGIWFYRRFVESTESSTEHGLIHL